MGTLMGAKAARHRNQTTNEQLFVIYYIEKNCFVTLSNRNIPWSMTMMADSSSFTRLNKVQANNTYYVMWEQMHYPTKSLVAFEVNVVDDGLDIMAKHPITLPIL
jgi:hypothetical protein